MSSSWLDGDVATTVALNNRGLRYGDGVFRTLLVWRGVIHEQKRQLEKLAHDAQVLGLAMPPADNLIKDLNRAAQSCPNGTLRICLTAGDSPRGYTRSSLPSHWIVQAADLPEGYAERAQRGLDLQGLAWQLASQPALAGVKHLNRLDQVMARRQLPAGQDEGLLRNQAGDWVSGIMSNLFWYADGQWHTPALQDCGVAGIARDWVMQHLDVSASAVQQSTHCSSEDLHQARCVFVCNSVMGLVPVRSWTDRQARQTRWPISDIQTFAPFTQLQRKFQHPLSHA